MNEDFTLTTFAEPITNLADEPQLPADEMKRRLQAPADELRQAHNALAQTVHGITEATYPDTVTEAMLIDELAAKINGKAEQTALTAEATAREAADDALDTELAKKCEVYAGTYTGDGTASRTISLGFTPKAVLVMNTNGQTTDSYRYSGGLAVTGQPCVFSDYTVVGITDGGFQVGYREITSVYYISSNTNGAVYLYVALA